MISLKGNSLSKIDRTSSQYEALQTFHERLKSKDSTIWGPEAQAEAAIRLNWIDLPESSRDLLPQLDALADDRPMPVSKLNAAIDAFAL